MQRQKGNVDGRTGDFQQSGSSLLDDRWFCCFQKKSFERTESTAGGHCFSLVCVVWPV